MSSPPGERRESFPDHVVSRDGTRVRTWTNGADGEPLVISNGLGAPPSAWSRLAAADCGFRAVSWWHRGLGGSERPEDSTRVRVEDHAADLEAVMDAASMTRALLLGWSVGVNVAFEFARAHPERVAGILGVAGIPGGSFRAFGPPGIPSRARESAGRRAAWSLRLVGPPAAALAPALLETARMLGAEFVPGMPDLSAAGRMARELAAHPWTWYSDVLVTIGAKPTMDTTSMGFPVTLVGGVLDIAAAAVDVGAAASKIPGARFVPLLGTHFLPFEQRDRLHRELEDLADRAHAVPECPSVVVDRGPGAGSGR
jgi:pimeloyl-ACP methyl ester carboxylesterase